MSTENKMTFSWQPALAPGVGSWAERLAAAIAADVASGRLAEGDRLPTQRALAKQLGVTTGTVNRGYAIAVRAGLLSAEVGRGTFVSRSSTPAIHDASLAREAAGAIELGLNYPAGVEAEDALRDTLARLARREPGAGLLATVPYAGVAAHRAAGAQWLRRVGVVVDADDVLMCTSVQHGLAAILAALTSPGDVVLTEHLTGPGLKALAALHHLRLVPVDGDDEGLLPDALASACRTTGARVLYTMPTLHTPTTLTMPDARRRAIADVLRAQGLTAIEDDAWGFLAGGRVTPLRTMAPDHVAYVTSVSKSLAPGLRVGYLVVPEPLRRAVTTCLGTLTWSSPLLGAVVSEWITDGTASAIVERRVRTARALRQLAETILGPAVVPSTFPTFHVWLPLADPWRVETFVAHAGALGVSLIGTDAFVPGRAPTPHAIRVCTGTEADVQRVERGLRVLAGILASGPAAYSVPAV